ncbi:DUF2935 domain-containing protein [Bacillus marinisedimentorum]|uniref:DUF2935 domain-containing protein n=1 Tax=Bacillus marinisedimentorum TaxID=1821260 RepID=UPI0007E0D648|nr:DUF2935 domain-containing protein [Bacillus marinisedimentorum]
MDTFVRKAVFEHRFWLQVLGDHCRFIFQSLGPAETDEIEQAQTLMEEFDSLYQKIDRARSIGQVNDVTKAAVREAGKLYSYKRELLKKQLLKEITFHLSPTFVNHMLNELEEYLRILEFLEKGKQPEDAHPVHHHLLWLLDASGHAGAIECSLDPAEKQLIHKSKHFKKDFEGFYLKAVEMAGYLRSSFHEFPALHAFNEEVTLEMKIFQVFLEELEEMEVNKEVLSTFSALMADHMFREECYYLIKLSETDNVSAPECDPGHPRTK